MFSQIALTTEIGSLKKFALRLTRNSSDADDLLQATLLQALEKRHMFQEGTNLFGWTSKIMFNLFVSEYRRRVKFQTQYDPEIYFSRLSVDAPQDKEMELKEVGRAMKTISKDHREILNMICINGMPYTDVSEKLDIPVGTVRSRLSRARESLKNNLDTPWVYQAHAAQNAVGGGSRAVN